MSEQLLTEILSEIKSLKSEVTTINNRLERVEGRLERVEHQMVTKEDMEENTAILRALEHASQVNAAEMEGLKLSTASSESVDRIENALDRVGTDLSYLVRKAVQHDDDIRELRRAK